MSKKILIIGGGLAGLSAGIHARQAGYDAVIYEKSNALGGCCSAWRRGEYTIDNCIHWLCGSREGAAQRKTWEEIGALNDQTEFVQRDSFYHSEMNGQTLTLWRDVEKTHTELLLLSPEDRDEIDRFIHSVYVAQNLLNNMEYPSEKTNSVADSFTSAISYAELVKALVDYQGLTLETWSARFSHPLLRQMILDFSAKEYEAYWLIVSYGIYSFSDADVPIGGSEELLRRIITTYQTLGGKWHCNCGVSRIVLDTDTVEVERPESDALNHLSIEENKQEAKTGITLTNLVHGFYETATGVILEDGSFVPADYIICACDLSHTFQHLLDPKYAPQSLKELYKDRSKTPVYSSFHVALSVDGLMEEVDDTLYFDCAPIDIGTRVITRLQIKNYRNYGDYIAPKGQTVIQCSIIQYPKDHDMWRQLRDENYPLYLHKKNYTAKAILCEMEKRFPTYEGRLHILDTWTPATYSARLNCYEGAYMRFITTLINTNAFLSNEVKDIHNVYLASHWLKYPGGTPMAVTTGKLAVKKIIASEKTFKFPNPLNLLKRKKETEELATLEEQINSISGE